MRLEAEKDAADACRHRHSTSARWSHGTARWLEPMEDVEPCIARQRLMQGSPPQVAANSKHDFIARRQRLRKRSFADCPSPNADAQEPRRWKSHMEMTLHGVPCGQGCGSALICDVWLVVRRRHQRGSSTYPLAPCCIMLVIVEPPWRPLCTVTRTTHLQCSSHHSSV